MYTTVIRSCRFVYFGNLKRIIRLYEVGRSSVTRFIPKFCGKVVIRQIKSGIIQNHSGYIFSDETRGREL